MRETLSQTDHRDPCSAGNASRRKPGYAVQVVRQRRLGEDSRSGSVSERTQRVLQVGRPREKASSRLGSLSGYAGGNFTLDLLVSHGFSGHVIEGTFALMSLRPPGGYLHRTVLVKAK